MLVWSSYTVDWWTLPQLWFCWRFCKYQNRYIFYLFLFQFIWLIFNIRLLVVLNNSLFSFVLHYEYSYLVQFIKEKFLVLYYEYNKCPTGKLVKFHNRLSFVYFIFYFCCLLSVETIFICDNLSYPVNYTDVKYCLRVLNIRRFN